MEEPYVHTPTVVLKRDDVAEALAAHDQRMTATSREQASQGASIATLNRSMDYVVEHQVKSTHHLEKISKVTDACFETMRAINGRTISTETTQDATAGRITEVANAVNNLRDALVVACIVFAPLLLWIAFRGD